MPKYIYTAMVINILFWGLWIRQFFVAKPESSTTIFTFLLLFFLSFGLSLSFLFYFYFYKKAPSFTNLRHIYRRSLKWSFFLSFGATFIFALKAFGLFTFINVTLFIILYWGLFLQIKAKR